MAATEDPSHSQSPNSQRDDSTFEWDDKSQLYFHASSGFYHDPNAGWYYSSRDGCYYKYENGSYVLLESKKEGEYDEVEQIRTVHDEGIQDDPCYKDNSVDDPDNAPPPSEWLEETLIDLYLTGYSTLKNNNDDKLAMSTETDVGYDSKLPVHGEQKECTREMEEGEWVEEELQDAAESSERFSDEGASWDEENWRAQYGQVVQTVEEDIPASTIIDLWDWEMITETVLKKKRGKQKKYQISRLIGKLVKPSSKLHPSMPSGGRLLKSAAICEVNTALVRVSSGQVYRLKSPSLKYLSSLTTYDSSNPTKDWGFPELSIDKPGISEHCDNETPANHAESSALPELPIVLEKNKGLVYRDRAAERRALHGGFGVGPGQKPGLDSDREASPVSDSTGAAAAEALHMAFGTGSYARKLLENMGWKEGEALGKSTKGLLQPLEAVGNKGFAGLGWNQRRPYTK